MEEAEDALRRLGVEVDFAGRTEIATLTTEALLRVAAAGWSLPRVVRVDPYPFAASYSGFFKHVPAMYVYADDAILINPIASFWRDPVAMAREDYSLQNAVTDEPLGVIYHELGHALHLRGAAPRYTNADWTDKNVAALRDRVSNYALRNPSEFVAEVFSGLMSGRTFGEDVMNWYRRFGGPSR